jgi:hypothetical protein
MALHAKFVYVDTQSFVKANLDFGSRTLRAFAQLALKMISST